MGIKKQLGMGVMSAALGIALVGGGTFAYFSDSEETNSTFAAGTLDLTAEPTEIINVDNIKPGDYMLRSFDLSNSGSLDIGEITMDTAYTVSDAMGNNSEDFGEHIRVDFLVNADKLSDVIWSKSLAQLKTMSPDAIKEGIFHPWLGEDGVLEAGTSDTLYVKFTFVDNGEDQNEFQGDSLQLDWTFNAKQTAGEAR